MNNIDNNIVIGISYENKMNCDIKMKEWWRCMLVWICFDYFD
jgi:hypothetical protein